jgi:hypothetical protein
LAPYYLNLFYKNFFDLLVLNYYKFSFPDENRTLRLDKFDRVRNQWIADYLYESPTLESLYKVWFYLPTSFICANITIG